MIRGPLDTMVDNFRADITDQAREQILAELTAGGAPCLWCRGVPLFSDRDRLLAHIHDVHPPAEMTGRLKATSDAAYAQLTVVRLAAASTAHPERVMAALNALDPMETV